MEANVPESDLVTEYLAALEKDWLISQEVWGTSTISGKRKRIDAVIKSKQHPHMVFGIEFKKPDLGSFTKFSAWFKQAIVYTQCLWESRSGDKRKLPILIAPTPVYCNPQTTDTLCRIVGEFGLGDINKVWNKHFKEFTYQLRIKETRIWCNHYGYNQACLKQNFNKYLEL